MTLADYERLRSEPTWFAIRPGHEILDVESVVERKGGYDIVQKHEGVPTRVAEEEDPRT
jgi:hypothetical protein